jgi:cytidine deaminase
MLRELQSKPGYTAVIESSAVVEILEREGIAREDFLVRLLPIASARAFVPVSNYQVGAACLGRSGNVYLGCNIEVPRQTLDFAVHAEQCAFANAFMHGERDIRVTAVNAAPCGHCRQFMCEFSPSLDLAIIIESTVETTLAQLLPEPFGPAHLGNTGGIAGASRFSLSWSKAPSTSSKTLGDTAFEAAVNSYAPYSRSPSGVALLTRGGRVFSGSYIENVAFNPSLPPLQSALSCLVQSGELPENITSCLMVEVKEAAITQKDGTMTALMAINAEAQFEVAYVKVSTDRQ